MKMATKNLSGIWRTEARRASSATALTLVPEPVSPAGKTCDAPGCTSPLFYSAKEGQMRGNYCAAHLLMLNDNPDQVQPGHAETFGVVQPAAWARRWIVPR
jgi:hypothetical protein